MAYKVWSVSTTTWADKVLVEPSSCTWATALDEGKSGQAQFKLGDPGVAEVLNAGLLAPLSRVLIVEWEGVPVYGGLILTNDYDRDTQTLTVSHTEAMWWILSRRHVLYSRGNDAAKHALSWSGISFGTLVNRILVWAQGGGTPAPKYKLPIIFPGDDPGNHPLTLHGYHMPLASEVIQDLATQDLGPDVVFRPRWAADGSIEWLRTSGTHRYEEFPIYDFHAGAPESGITNLTVRIDGAKVTNHLFALGEGSEKNMLVEAVTDPSSPYLALERSVAFKEESNPAILRSRGLEELATSKTPTMQVSMDIPANGTPNAGSLRLNSTIRWIVTGDPFIKPGWQEGRVIEFSGDIASNRVHLEFQPLGG